MQAQQSLKFPRVPLLRYDPGDLRTACRQRDGKGVALIALVRAHDKRCHMARVQQAHAMAQCLELPCPVMRATASFHDDFRRHHLRENLRIFEAEYDRLHNRVPRGPTAQS